MNKLVLFGAVVLLAACEPTEEQQKNLKEALPPGCAVVYNDAYGDVRKMIVIVCDKFATTQTITATPVGKGGQHVTHSVVITRE